MRDALSIFSATPCLGEALEGHYQNDSKAQPLQSQNLRIALLTSEGA